MTNFIPIVPLDIIVYPDEILTLRLTDPKHTQLIRDCYEEQKQFGIPLFHEEQIREYGTLAGILTIGKEQADGTLEVRIKGQQVFRMLEEVKNLPEKPYSGAIVSYPENDKMKVHPNLSKLIHDEVKRLYTLLNIENRMPDEKQEWSSYDIAHKLGLTREQEYDLLSIFNEVQRMEYLRRYFNSIMPEVDDLDILKSRINLN
ncbi:LON peptidase substrate-binding domain-containing protein [Taibaiella koreensis]|uniref:LON peptidase substrate-binding domain-containing protein n=1 Tax=Taibaiella koreensis TaxID=1268548 RepID=UPI000E59AE40|nr:LON peptidase substrate-binding domain-containing protein [Taibaiella koreensis]